MRRVGIDLAFTAPHQAVVYEDGEALGRPFRVARTKEGMDELIRKATAGHDGPCEFVMEPTGLAWLPVAAELVRQGHRAYVPKPQKTKALRKVYSPFAKSDGVDARAAALLRHVDPNGVHELRIPKPERTSMRLLVRQRGRLSKQRVKSMQRIHGWLRLANPHLSSALGTEAFTRAAMAFLRRYVDPFAVRRLGKSRLRAYWARHAHGPVNAKQFEATWRACEATCEMYAGLHRDGALPFEYVVLQEMVASELDLMASVGGQIKRLSALIRERHDVLDPQRVLESEVPGVGPTISAAIEAFVGDVERFPNVKTFAAYFGIVPRTNQTGGRDRSRQRMTKGGPNVLKQYMYLAAEVARRQDPEMAATYDTAIGRGKHHRSAVIIVAHKLVRRIYAILKQRAAGRAVAAASAAGAAARPTVRYRLRRPDGVQVTKDEARAYVATHHPSKAAVARRQRAAEAGPQDTGSSEDATKEVASMPPDSSISDAGEHLKGCGETVDRQRATGPEEPATALDCG
jgi:transposase